jgi:type I restriction enzyme S subunit
MNDWADVPFSKTITEPPARHGKLLARDYKVSGHFPVVDQGQDQIAGWVDDERLVISEGLPYVVFGDHTRIFKYVDFPFVLGADGTQLLKPAIGFNPRFFYYACLNLDIPNRGYNRHFALVKEQTFPLPPKPEQEKIAAVLWKVQKAVEAQDKLIRITRELKAAAMRRLFTRGLRNEPLKQTEIGPVPESWRAVRLDACCDVVSSSLSYTDLAAMDDVGAEDVVEVHGVKVSDMNLPGNELTFATANLARRIQQSLAERKAIPPMSVVFPKRGAAIATNKKRLTTTWTVLDPNLIGMRPQAGLDHLYLFYWIEMFDLRTITEPGPTPQLNKKNLVPLLIPVPDTEDEQRAIAHILQTLDRKITLHEKKRAALQDLFQTLLHKLMTAKIRVNDLDIDTSEVVA